jgi:hypothetical protein
VQPVAEQNPTGLQSPHYLASQSAYVLMLTVSTCRVISSLSRKEEARWSLRGKLK